MVEVSGATALLCTNSYIIVVIVVRLTSKFFLLADADLAVTVIERWYAVEREDVSSFFGAGFLHARSTL